MENSKEFVMPSGVKLQITMADFEDADALTTALLKALDIDDLGDIEIGEGLKLSDLGGSSAYLKVLDVPGLLAKVVARARDIVVNKEVKEAIFRCATRALYGGEKIVPALFDHPKLGLKARGDYFTIWLRLIEVNVAPFFVGTFSALKNLAPKEKDAVPA